MTPLAGDASLRRYFRLSKSDGQRCIVMDAPPETVLSTATFVEMSRRLGASGLSPPDILAQDLESGFLLLEDLGDDLFVRVIADDPVREEPLYQEAVDLLISLHGQCDLARDLPRYDTATAVREASLLAEWYRAFCKGNAFPGPPDPQLNALIARHWARFEDTNGLVLRDCHAENLIWLPDRSGLARIGLLDFQDALCGPPVYDLVSLLEDARRDVSPDLRERMISRYCSALGVRETSLRADFCLLSAQRNMKILGLFLRVWHSQGKDGYLALLPRVWDHLMRDLAHPELTDLRDWVGENLIAPEGVS